MICMFYCLRKQFLSLEYSYGGHPFECTGIFDNSPRDAEELGENFRCVLADSALFVMKCVQIS